MCQREPGYQIRPERISNFSGVAFQSRVRHRPRCPDINNSVPNPFGLNRLIRKIPFGDSITCRSPLTQTARSRLIATAGGEFKPEWSTQISQSPVLRHNTLFKNRLRFPKILLCFPLRARPRMIYRLKKGDRLQVFLVPAWPDENAGVWAVRGCLFPMNCCANPIEKTNMSSPLRAITHRLAKRR